MSISLRVLAAASFLSILSACATQPLPPEVSQFIEHREVCEHFRGEAPDAADPQRVRAVLASIASTCRGTDAELARLKDRYRDDKPVLKRLNKFEARIERDRP